MMKKSYSMTEWISNNNIDQLDKYLKISKRQFERKFGLQFPNEIEVKLSFEDEYSTQIFYNELRLNKLSYGHYRVRSAEEAHCLYVSGARTLFEFFGHEEPNLLTASRDLSVDFDILYRQKFTGIEFTASVIAGELLSRHCVVEYSNVLPELSLGGLHKIADSAQEFELLLTRIYPVKERTIL